MKVAIVPAQVTTIEDKVAGGLGLKQLVLLVAPVFLSGVLYSLAPPSFTLVAYKLILMAVLGISIGSLAIRFKGMLLLQWVVVLTRYMSRPQYYVYDKNSSAARRTHDAQQPELIEVSEEELPQHTPSPAIPVHERVVLESLINEPGARLHFQTDKKGKLRVAISKAE